MSEELETIESAAKEACRHAKNMMFEGAVPTYLGVNGMLALMHDSIRRYITDPQEEHLLSLVAHGIHALTLSKEDEGWDDTDGEIEDHHPRLIRPGLVLRSDIEEFLDGAEPIIGDEEGDDGTGRWAPAPGSAKSDLPTYDPKEDEDNAKE